MEPTVNLATKQQASLVVDFFKRFQDGDTLDVIAYMRSMR